MFDTEYDMQISFESLLRSIFSEDEAIIASHLSGLFGIPDLVLMEPSQGVTKHIVAMELKLSSWKRALIQAFRYRSFAWESYVVIDACRSSAALSNLNEFRKRNIGFATYSSNYELVVHCRPKIHEPYSRILSQKVAKLLYQNNTAECLNKKKPSRSDGLGKAFYENTGKRKTIAFGDAPNGYAAEMRH